MKRIAAGAVGLLCSLVIAVPAHAAGTWHEVPLPFLWPNRSIDDITASGPDKVWVSGHQGEFCVPNYNHSCSLYSLGNPVVRRWNGSKWVEYPIFGLGGGSGPIENVEAFGSEVWITSQNAGYVGRFDGTVFRKIAMPKPGAASVSAGPAGVWARQVIGDTTFVYRWTGSGWTETPLPPGVIDIEHGVQARVSDEAWTVGWKTTTTNHGVYSMLRWNGSAWQDTGPIPSPPNGPLNEVIDMAVVGPGEVVAIIDPWPDLPNPTHFFRYKDGAWTPMEGPGGRYTRVLTDGTGALVSGGPNHVRDDGSGWKPIPEPEFFHLNGIAAVPGSDVLWGLPTTTDTAVVTNG